MGLGIVFSGQGNQNKDMFAKYANVLNIDYIHILSDKLGIKLIPQIDLNDNYSDDNSQSGTIYSNRMSIFDNIYAQPLIVAYEFCIWGYLKDKLPEPVAFAGYSLGEVTAVACASNFSFDELLDMAQARAEFMSNAIKKDCGMLAVSGVPVEVMQDICNKNNTYISIINSLQKVIIGGEITNLKKCDIEVKLRSGTIKTQWLKTNVPSHTPLLLSASTDLINYLNTTYVNKQLHQRLVSGINGDVQYSLSTALENLSAQISQTIYFDKVIQVLYELGVDLIIEIGPGHGLANIIKQQNLPIQVKSVDDFKSLADIPAWVSKYSCT